jgi:hypothetical protein
MNTPVEEITEIPIWCHKLFYEDQEDPDKDPGFKVTTRLWSSNDTLLLEGSFMYVGQDDHTVHELACGTGDVHRCMVYWKSNSVECEHDMQGLKPLKGDRMEVRLHNLRRIG